jgi:diguanylate cyclase (GGDEF)-like protein
MTPDLLIAASAILAGWLAHAAALRRRLHAAHHDPVTGLPTRATWTRQARKLLRRGHHVVLLIDLDRFKDVNDTHGHAAGDQALAVTAARIRAWTDRTGGGACGRLGGDEFAIVTRGPVGSRELADLAAVLAGPVTLPAAGPVPGGASVGAATCTASAGLSSALGTADAAMYEAKRDGGGWRLTACTDRRADSPARRTRHHGPEPAGQPAGNSPGRPAPVTQGK